MTNVVGTANSLVGQSGDMPIDMYLRKLEQTCLYESPFATEDYQRDILKDLSPDAPFFESDQPRGGVDENGVSRGGYQSEARINLRSGARTLTDPYIAEGSFTDWQFLEQDPRGVANEPNMRKHVEQQYARGGLYNYRDDNDHSIPSQGVTPWNMQMNIRNAQHAVKDYKKIFNTAFDGWTNAGVKTCQTKSIKEQTCNDQEIKDPKHASNRNRSDVTNNLSNDTSIGWRRTTDHRFKVSKYGKIKTGKNVNTEDWWKNRASAHTDHDTKVSWKTHTVDKNLALLMMDLTRLKQVKNSTADTTIFGNSKDIKNNKKILSVADISGMAVRPSKETRSMSAHTSLDGNVKNKSGKSLYKHDSNVIEKTYINPTIVEKMSNVNRRLNNKITDDLRDSIKKSAADKGIYMSEANTKKVNKTDQSAIWGGITLHEHGTSKQVKNYKSAVKAIEDNGGKKLKKMHNSANFKESYKTNQRRGRLDKDMMTTKSAKVDNEFGKEVTNRHLVGPMGSKYMNKYMLADTVHGELDDLSTN